MDTLATDGEAHSDAKLDGDVRPKPQYIKQRSVQIIDPRPEIVEVREKHGPLYNAIPRMPLGLAVLCCLFNIVIPGVGKLVFYTINGPIAQNRDSRQIMHVCRL